MQLLLRAGWAIGQSLGQMLSQQVTNTEAREAARRDGFETNRCQPDLPRRTG